MPASRSLPSIDAARAAVAGGDLVRAGSIADARLAADPGDVDALEIRAMVASVRGDHATAERTLRAAIAAAPARRWPRGDLARLLTAQGRKGEAERVLHAALGADAGNPDAHAMLGSLLVERGLPAAAATHFERAIALAGRHPQLLGALGHALLRQGRLDAARALLEEASRAAPGALLPIVHLAELEERAGRFEVAAALLDRAEVVAAAEGRDVTLQRAALLARSGAGDAALALLDGQAEMAGPALLLRGRLRDRTGRHAEAWGDWTCGKAMLAAAGGRRYPAAAVRAEAEALAGFFTAERVRALPRAGVRADVPQPIFVLGFPRSGTTLTEQILASHSAIRAGGELPFGHRLRDLAVTLAGGEGAFPAGLDAMLAADKAHWPALLRDAYLAMAEAAGLTAPGAAFFTDKMPLNDLWLPLLRLAFPEAPVVLVRRHPLDVLTSVMAHDLTHGFNCGYRLEDAARHLALVDEVVARYRAAGVSIDHELGYEALVADQAGETARLMAAIGLAMEPAQLAFHERETVSPTPSYAQVREPLNDRSIGRWRRHRAALEPVRPLVAAAMARGGYSG